MSYSTYFTFVSTEIYSLNIWSNCSGSIVMNEAISACS